MSNRRNFIQQTLLGATGAAILPLVGNASTIVKPVAESKHPLTVGIAGYTFKSFSIDQSIAMMKRIGVSNLSLKDIHLPVNSTDTQISDAMAKFKAGGINIYTVGVIYMKTKDAVDAAVAYAKKLGVNMIVRVPNYELIE